MGRSVLTPVEAGPTYLGRRMDRYGGNNALGSPHVLFFQHDPGRPKNKLGSLVRVLWLRQRGRQTALSPRIFVEHEFLVFSFGKLAFYVFKLEAETKTYFSGIWNGSGNPEAALASFPPVIGSQTPIRCLFRKQPRKK